MNCPRCLKKGGQVVSAYRGEARHGEPVALGPEVHEFGPTIARCRSCRGAFVEHQDLLAIENGGRKAKRKITGAVSRAYDPPTAPIPCPSCASETTRREWSIGTLVFVDVCIECRGVWLDPGELETLGG